MLSCSFDEVSQRLANRGKHRFPAIAQSNAAAIADAYLAVLYNGNRDAETFFGMSAEEFGQTVHVARIVWAPDGDEAFDDGSHVLQFDEGSRVRLVAFTNTENRAAMILTLSDVWIASDTYYDLLSEWMRSFENQMSALSGVPGI